MHISKNPTNFIVDWTVPEKETLTNLEKAKKSAQEIAKDLNPLPAKPQKEVKPNYTPDGSSFLHYG